MNSGGNTLSLDAPSPDELEISLFGPGYGESIAVHMGGGRWMIVDACIDSKTGRPAVLDYLEQIGVDYTENVVVVLATHWDDDHIRGLGEVVERCTKARFAFSSAFRSIDFLTLVESGDLGTRRLSSGPREFARTLSVLKARKAAGDDLGGAPRIITENTIIDRSQSCEVRALSPSSAAVEAGQKAIAALLPKHLQPRLRVSEPSPNSTSIVLWLHGSAGTALLGADLDRTSHDDTGWGAVVALAPAASGRATLVKVPHHGSITAHDQRMWSELLTTNPDAMLTPWTRAGKRVPSEDDRLCICGLAPDAVIAGQAGAKTTQYNPAVERTLREVAISRHVAVGRMGHIRARCAPSDKGQWRVDLIHDAQRLCAA